MGPPVVQPRIDHLRRNPDEHRADAGFALASVDPSPCISYDGCDSGCRVVWCPVDGKGHAIPSFAAGGIANFFSQI
jgi:polyhydroxybutyrate depolymerase